MEKEKLVTSTFTKRIPPTKSEVLEDRMIKLERKTTEIDTLWLVLLIILALNILIFIRTLK